jgi:hypothetical protein
VYPGQLALPVGAPDTAAYVPVPNVTARYLVSDASGNMTYIDGPVYDTGTDENSVYDYARLYNWRAGTTEPHGYRSGDPYNLFLCGPQPVVVLTNGNTQSERNLYIFRDSFSSSFAPLIAATGAYRTVTLIDLRYIDWKMLETTVEFAAGSAALFLFGSQIWNSASVLKVGA